MADKKLINDYCKEVADEFVNKYLKELDDNIYKMLNAFGFEGDMNDAGKWLEDNCYKLAFDEEFKDEKIEEYNLIYATSVEEFKDTDGVKTKSIYLVDNNTNCVVGIFFVRTYLEDGNLCYEMSDVFINRI